VEQRGIHKYRRALIWYDSHQFISPLMLDKQKEMDSVIRSIYETVAEDDRKRRELSHDAHGTLIVLCGDHGMNEAGNHGGSSESETSTVSMISCLADISDFRLANLL
jgi:hypothetical protein